MFIRRSMERWKDSMTRSGLGLRPQARLPAPHPHPGNAIGTNSDRGPPVRQRAKLGKTFRRKRSAIFALRAQADKMSALRQGMSFQSEIKTPPKTAVRSLSGVTSGYFTKARQR